jgi:DNA mismatch endonuclease (patch repair protein)
VNRSENMRAIRSKDMLPELAVRSLAHKLGYRYRLHRKDLRVIFVHGCFWHSHDCRFAHTPKSNLGYWMPKLARNQARDEKSIEALTAAGWKALVIWECETKDEASLNKRLKTFLDGAIR